MKNVHERQLKKCILIPFDEFKDMIEEITDGLLTVKDEFEISISETSKAVESNTYWEEDIIDTLSEYFNVTVKSFHSDNYIPTGVWICYEG